MKKLAVTAVIAASLVLGEIALAESTKLYDDCGSASKRLVADASKKMNYHIRLKCVKAGSSSNYEKSYTIHAASQGEAEAQAIKKCQAEGYKVIEVMVSRAVK